MARRMAGPKSRRTGAEHLADAGEGGHKDLDFAANATADELVHLAL